MTQSKKKTFLAVTFFVILLAALFMAWYFLPKTTLTDLQKESITATTPADTQRVIDRLDKYYLRMSIPNSMRRQIQHKTDSLIVHQQYCKLDRNFPTSDTNIYVVENKLSHLIDNALIALVRGDKAAFEQIMTYARILAEKVDEDTENNCWRPGIAKMERFDADQAMNWLLADQAAQACKDNHLTNYSEAEKYGAWALQLLRPNADARLRLDVIQCLMTILSRSRAMYDLSFLLAQTAFQQADEIKYHLRATGIIYNYANALRLAGQENLALNYFLKSVQRAEKQPQVLSMDWYNRNGLIGVAKVYWQMGKYEEALSICEKIERQKLKEGEKIELHILRGVTHRNLGNYDQAEAAYKEALTLAERISDSENQIIVLKDLGTFYHRLTEYDKAEFYYNKAMELHRSYNPNNIERKIRLLISIAENYAGKNNLEDFKNSIARAIHHIEKINLPVVKAELSRSIGRLNMKMQKYQDAHDNFQAAVDRYEANGLLRAALETKNDLIECLMHQSKYKEASKLLDEAILLARNIHDSQHLIDAMGMKAEMAHQQGNINKAIQISNQLINEIESLSSRLNKIDNQTIFQQKVHDHLKRAVCYELEKGRTDLAFIKLDYLKARSLKNRQDSNNNKKSSWGNPSSFINIDTLMAHLKEQQLIVNYLVTPDTLYAFVINNKNFYLLRKPVNIEQLNKLIDEYLTLNFKTYTVFQAYQPAVYDSHYDSVLALGYSLYQVLLDWPELQLELKNTKITYIIPDDILYAVPFACLNDKDQSFLIDKTAIAYLPGAIFAQFSQHKKAKHDIAQKKVLVSSANHHFRAALDLVTFIKNRFPLANELIIDKPVITKKDILSELASEQYDIYFFLGHSAANTTFPDSCYFEMTALAKDSLKPTTVKVTLAELKMINWSGAETVLLVGCETAIGKFYKGTGVVGIQQSILAAGASEVLASMWAIDAKHAIPQINDFFSCVEHTANSVLALQRVQQEKVKSLTKDIIYRKPFPYFWAGFMIYQNATVYN